MTSWQLSGTFLFSKVIRPCSYPKTFPSHVSTSLSQSALNQRALYNRTTQTMKLPVSLLAGIGLVAFSVAGPVATNSLSAETSIVPALDYALDRRADPGDFYLRIMPLGASIIAGDYSPPEKNGYRKFTRDKLRSDGWKVNMVGNFNQGSMSDNVRVPGRPIPATPPISILVGY